MCYHPCIEYQLAGAEALSRSDKPYDAIFGGIVNQHKRRMRIVGELANSGLRVKVPAASTAAPHLAALSNAVSRMITVLTFCVLRLATFSLDVFHSFTHANDASAGVTSQLRCSHALNTTKLPACVSSGVSAFFGVGDIVDAQASAAVVLNIHAREDNGAAQMEV